MGSLYQSLSSFLPQQLTAPVANGSTIAGYRGLDLSSFVPGASAPVIENVAPLNMAGTDAPGASTGGFFGSMLGGVDANGNMQQGWGGLALGAAQGLGNAWMGMKQYGLAKDALKENKRQFNVNYEAQRKLTNSQLEDRQRARVASNAGAYESVGSYMNRNGIK